MIDLAASLTAALGPRFSDDRAAILAAGRAYAYTNPAGHKRLVIHHSAGPREQTIEQIDAFHRDGRGWPGIGYNFVARLGVLRYVGDVGTERAHIWGRNADSIGVCVTGSYEDGTRPAVEDIAVIRELVAVLDDAYRPLLPIVGHGPASLVGHGTACPGRNLLAMLPTLRGADPSPAVLDAHALQVAEANVSVALNPNAAIDKAILRSGFVPVGHEREFDHEGKRYVTRPARNPVTGAGAAFYCESGKWDKVRAVPLP